MKHLSRHLRICRQPKALKLWKWRLWGVSCGCEDESPVVNSVEWELPISTFMIKMPGTPVVTWNKLRRGDTDRCGKCCTFAVVLELYNLVRQAKLHSPGARCHWHWSSSWERLRVFVRFRIWSSSSFLRIVACHCVVLSGATSQDLRLSEGPLMAWQM